MLSPAASRIGFGRVFVMRDVRTGWVRRENGGTETGMKLPLLMGIVRLKGDDIIMPRNPKMSERKMLPHHKQF